jgi:hypothetical protein
MDNNTESYILIRFQGLGDAQPAFYFNNVNAFQIMGAASALEVHGKNFFIQAENAKAEETEKIAVAKPEILVPGK